MDNGLLTREHYNTYNKTYLDLGKSNGQYGVIEGLCTTNPNEKFAFIGGKMDFKPNEKVLDAGSGFGYPALYFAEIFKVDLTGININKEQLKVSNGVVKGTKNLRFKECNFNNISSLNTIFDKMIFIETIGHSDDLDKTFSEMYNNLAPGGTVFIQTTFSTGENLTFLKRQEKFWGYSNYMEKDFIKKALNAGFVIQENSEFPEMKWNKKGVRDFIGHIKSYVKSDDRKALDYLDSLGVYCSYWKYIILRRKSYGIQS
jgi:cyclopropane fatty-acyl-phospholipid synthase-like methyltransferase